MAPLDLDVDFAPRAVTRDGLGFLADGLLAERLGFGPRRGIVASRFARRFSAVLVRAGGAVTSMVSRR
jgi:hypothetical protein